MLGFEGTDLPGWVVARLETSNVPGFTLFATNISSVSQLTELCTRLHRGEEMPRLIATDQEGGQLNAFGDGTPFPGNMALGAVGDPDLAREVGMAVGRELRAVGITVNYAPVCDVASRPGNPSLGIRSFGEDPELVAKMAAAMVEGMQSSGVAAVVKHFPGKGEAEVDPHYELPVLDLDRDRFEQVEFPPFLAGIGAGARMVMMGHYACPELTGSLVPASLSPVMVDGILRQELGFDGVVITDALDMGAVHQDGAVDASAAIAAGVDLLLCARDPDEHERIRARLREAVHSGSVLPEVLEGSVGRVRALREWLSSFDPPEPSVVGNTRHRELAAQVATRALTLVRDQAGLVPLSLDVADRVLAIMPKPVDLTPADTSSRVPPGLADALRSGHPHVTELLVDHDPSREQIAAGVSASFEHKLVVVGTITVTSGQADLMKAILATGTPTVAVALRTPDDLALYPEAPTYLCTYGFLPPSMAALADALYGRSPITGRLPVSIPGLYPAGHSHAEHRS